MEISIRIDPNNHFIAAVFRKIYNIIFGNSVIKRKQLWCCKGLSEVEYVLKPPVAGY